MDLILDGNGPLYLQLARALKSAVQTGRLPDGARLPASRELAWRMGLSRTTVVAAFEQLRADGLVHGRVGSGSYVCAPRRAPRARGLRTSVAPQSAYARRARAVHDPLDVPGKRQPGLRHVFEYGTPMLNTTLSSRWTRELARAASYTSANYPPTQGLAALREAIAAHVVRTRGVACGADDILITAGTQQALSLVARVLVDPDDVVAIEDPQYFGARRVFAAHGARLHEVPVDAQGLVVERLPMPAAKLVYVTPSHQFPTGVVLSLARRRALLEYASRHGTWICEDDYDGEFRHDDAPVPALQSLDRDGRVLYVGTFSKTLFPALRLGYLVVPPSLMRDFVTAKWLADFGSPPIEQAALAGLIAGGAYDRHLRLITRRLAERRTLLAQRLQARCGDRVEILGSRAGMHTLVWLQGDAAMGERVMRRAIEVGLGLMPVAPCYIEPPSRPGFIMGFGAMSLRELRDAIDAFARCIDTA